MPTTAEMSTTRVPASKAGSASTNFLKVEKSMAMEEASIMIQSILLYSGAALTVAWGVAHLFPTKAVVEGFGEITADNKRIITMEWIVEGVALIYTGALVGTVTVIDPSNAVSRSVYLLSVASLLILAVVSLFTGFRVRFFPFKLCPFIFSASAVLILLGGVIL